MSGDEFTPEEEWLIRRSYRTMADEVQEHTPVGTACIAIRVTGEPSLGVMAISVCGRPVFHEGPHQAGWTGSGEEWTDEVGS
jgi:hypothetical protein